MQLRQLRYFVAIVDRGSLSRAALVLHVAHTLCDSGAWIGARPL